MTGPQSSSPDIVERLNDHCVGHPHAKIEWPHRLLHDARDEILRLRATQPADGESRDALIKFFKWAMQEGPWEGGDLDGGSIQDKAESLGLIVKTKFDPAKHGDPYNDHGEGDDWYEFASSLATQPAAPAGGGGEKVISTSLDQVSCKELSNCGWPECDCPRRIDAHSPEAVAYAFNKASELLVSAGFQETASLLQSCRPTPSPIAQSSEGEGAVAATPSMREALEEALAEHDWKKTQQVTLTEPRWVNKARVALAIQAAPSKTIVSCSMCGGARYEGEDCDTCVKSCLPDVAQPSPEPPAFSAAMDDMRDPEVARAMRLEEYQSKPGSAAPLSREAIAFELWQRFAPVHHIGWADETHKAEYYAAADGVLALPSTEGK